jgi:hypothetical protein
MVEIPDQEALQDQQDQPVLTEMTGIQVQQVLGGPEVLPEIQG